MVTKCILPVIINYSFNNITYRFFIYVFYAKQGTDGFGDLGTVLRSWIINFTCGWCIRTHDSDPNFFCALHINAVVAPVVNRIFAPPMICGNYERCFIFIAIVTLDPIPNIFDIFIKRIYCFQILTIFTFVGVFICFIKSDIYRSRGLLRLR